MSSKIIENSEVQKKKRDRPKKVETLVETTVDASIVKKKRGRPKKVSLYGNFSENITNLFNNYVDINKDLLNMFINHEDNRLSQSEWNKINEHIISYINKLEEKDFFIKSYGEYSYKPNSSWKTLDTVRENSRRKYVKELMNESAIQDETYRAYLIFYHLKCYISETAKGIKN